MENNLTASLSTFATFKTGDDRNMENVLRQQGCLIGKFSAGLMEHDSYKNSVSKKEETVEIVAPTAFELTGKRFPTFDEIKAAGIAKGYDLCQPEDGPRLCEVHRGTDSIIIAMEAIRFHGSDPLVFEVFWGDNKLLLAVCCAYPFMSWHGGRRFAFRRRKVV